MNYQTLTLLGILIGGTAGWFSGAGVAQDQVPSALKAAASMTVATGPEEGKISTLDAAAIKSRLDAFLADSGHNTVELPLLMARWVMADLEAAKAWMRAFPDKDSNDYDERSQPLKEFFKAWAAIDPKSALAEALAIGKPKTFLAQDSVIAGLAKLDFSVIKEVLTSIPAGENNPKLATMDLLKQLTSRDRAAAMDLVSTLQGKLAEGAVEGIAKVWARTDPASALAWAQQNPNTGVRDTAINAVLTEWARKDPAAVGPFLLSHETEATAFHAGAAAEAIGQLATTDPEAALAFAKQYFPADYLKANLNQLFWRVLHQEEPIPQAAATMCGCVNLLPLEALQDARLFANSWPADLTPCWDSVLAEPDSPGRNFLLAEMGKKMCGQQLVKLIDDLVNEPNESVRDSILLPALSGDAMFHNMDKAQVERLQAMLPGLPEKVQGKAALQLGWGLASSDPLAAAALVQQYPAAAEGNFVLNLGIQLMHKVELTEARTWADQLPSAVQADAYSGIVHGAYRDDSEGISRWTQGLPAGPGKDGAASGLAYSAREDDPAAAFAWAISIQDEKLIQNSVKTVLDTWMPEDRAAALQALENAPLTSEQKASILKAVSPTNSTR